MKKNIRRTLELACFYGSWLLLAAAPLSIWRQPSFAAGRPELLSLYRESVMAAMAVGLTFLFRRMMPGDFRLPSLRKLAENLVLGAGLGFFWTGGAIGLLALTGRLKFVRLGPPVSGPTLAAWIFSLMFSALARELLLHGVLFDRKESFWAPMAVSSALSLVLFQPGDALSLANVLGNNLLLSALQLRTGGAAACCGARFIRNLTGGLLFGGLALGECPSLIEFAFRGPWWLSGGSNGLESGLLALAVSLALSGVLLFPMIREKLKAFR